MKTKYTLFVAIWAACCMTLGLTACNSSAYKTTVKTAVLSAAVVDFEASLNSTDATIDQYKDHFTDSQWLAVESVRVSTKRIHAALNAILTADDAKQATVDIGELITVTRELRHNYKRAYTEIRPALFSYPPSLRSEIMAFHQSIKKLDAAYNSLVNRDADNTQLIIETLRIVGAGVKLFGA